MSPTQARIQALVATRALLEPWLGPINESALEALLESQLGSAMALEAWIPRGDTRCRAVPLPVLLHVVSGNTPHAAFQSVFRGLLVGCHNLVKLPSEGLPEFEHWIAQLPPNLANLVELSHVLPPSWMAPSGAVIFGNQDTIETFRERLPRSVRLIEHGPKLSIAVVFRPDAEAAERAAIDILAHDQRGCLSVQAVYVDAPPDEVREFASQLARAMELARETHPRSLPTLSESGSISNARELARFRSAVGEDVALWESPSSTSWTVVYDHQPLLAPGPLHGFVTVHPLPAPEQLKESLGSEIHFLSTAAIHPFEDACADRLDPLAVPRICPLGRSQQPSLHWHHDGRPPLADLVTWQERSP